MTSRHELRAPHARKPLLKSARFWVPIGIVIVLLGTLGVGGYVIGKQLYGEAMAAKADLEKAIPLVDDVQASMLAEDTPAAQETAQKIADLTASAAHKTGGELWRNTEWVPFVGANLHAVRVAADSAETLARDALLPLTSLDVKALVPTNGAIDLAHLQELTALVDGATTTVEEVRTDLDAIDRGALIGQVSSAVAKLDDGLARITPYLEPVSKTLALLPKALGSEGPRNYLVLFQNNAESRGTGGNPAAIALLTADNGAISLMQQASSADFPNGLTEPIIPLDPETTALYGEKIGQYIQDTTLTPDFSETAEIVRAFWSASFGTPIDGVASFDPVALSYLLRAIGPVTLPTGDVLTSDNAVQALLSDVYYEYPNPGEGEYQDAFFAGAASAIFEALITQPADPKIFIEQLVQAADEGRLMFSPSDPEEAAFIEGTEISGTLPETNAESTVLAAYVNDITEGKLDYYLQLDTAAQCTADSGYTISAALTNTLTDEQAENLPWPVAPGRYFPPGDISTDLVLYGPVDAALVAVTVDGAPASVTALPHLGRSAVKVNVLTEPGVSHTVAATFAVPEGTNGPLSIRHTPMVRPTAETLVDCG